MPPKKSRQAGSKPEQPQIATKNSQKKPDPPAPPARDPAAPKNPAAVQSGKKRARRQPATDDEAATDEEATNAPRKKARRQTTRHVQPAQGMDLADGGYFKVSEPRVQDLLVLSPVSFPRSKDHLKKGNQFYDLGHPRSYSYRNPLTIPGFNALRWHDMN